MMARKRAKGLSEKHKKILEVLERHQQQYGYPPSIREICEKTGIRSTSVVNYYLNQLEDAGYIERDGRVSRGIRLRKPLSGLVSTATASFQQATQTVQQTMDELLHLRLVGRIIAGAPIPVPGSDFSYYDAESMVDIARSLLPDRERNSSDLYALEVQGDSMIDAMVNDGDIVVMKPVKEVRNGEMVAVWLNDREETTLKYFYLENDGRVRLQPANPTMQPIYENAANIQVQGKVVMVIRRLGGVVVA